MRLTRQQLINLEEQPEFHQLPAVLAFEQGVTHWKEMGPRIRHEAAKATCWMALHYLANLFEAYPRQMNSALVSWNNGHDDYPQLKSHFRINEIRVEHERSRQGPWLPISRHFQEMRDLDDGVAMDETMDWFKGLTYGDHVCHELVNQVSTFERIFKEPILSAQEARARAREHAPEVEAWVKRNLLEAGLVQATAPAQSARAEPKL